MFRMSIAFLVASILVSTGPLRAQAATAGDLEQNLRAEGELRELTEMFIHGISQGVLTANVISGMSQGQRTVCPGPDRTVDADEATAIFLTFMRSNSDLRDSPPALAVLFALSEKFPCKKD